jgi:hypothetical protein
MYFAIIGNKNKMCLLDVKSKFSNIYFSLCGKEYDKTTYTLLSLDQVIDTYFCPICDAHVRYLYGINDNQFYYNSQQQNIINSQGEYKMVQSKIKRKISGFSIMIKKIKRTYESR